MTQNRKNKIKWKTVGHLKLVTKNKKIKIKWKKNSSRIPIKCLMIIAQPVFDNVIQW